MFAVREHRSATRRWRPGEDRQGARCPWVTPGNGDGHKIVPQEPPEREPPDERKAHRWEVVAQEPPEREPPDAANTGRLLCGEPPDATNSGGLLCGADPTSKLVVRQGVARLACGADLRRIA